MSHTTKTQAGWNALTHKHPITGRAMQVGAANASGEIALMVIAGLSSVGLLLGGLGGHFLKLHPSTWLALSGVSVASGGFYWWSQHHAWQDVKQQTLWRDQVGHVLSLATLVMGPASIAGAVAAAAKKRSR